MTQVMVCRVESGESCDPLKFVQPADIIHPARAALRISGDAQKDHEDIQGGGDGCGNDKDAEQLALLKVEFRSRIRYAFKPDKSPGRDKGYTDDLAEYACVRQKGRAHSHIRPAVPDHGGCEAEGDADGEDQHHDHHDPGRKPFALHTEQTDKPHHDQSHQGFPKVDLIAEDRVKIPLPENCMQKVTRKQREARGVGPEDSYVDQEHEPGDQEGQVIAEKLLDIVVQATCPRIMVGQIMIVA